MAKMNFDYFTNIDQYSDGDIENQMLEIAESGKTLKELDIEEVSFPIVYHFSKVREDILSWYMFKKDATVLEIGAGCGAITGMLCEKNRKVTAVELSKRRASINYARHKDCDNLEIMVGNLNDMVFEEKFDYVVLNGVLEYAASFTHTENPYHTFLENMRQYLKANGRLLIAIENRLGLKYFSGAPEDHTDLYFYGLERYPNNNSVKTFSKTELQNLLKESGFVDMRFYYPYPDYKFPAEIFTDASITSGNYGRAYKNYTEDRVELFSENAVAQDFVKEGVADIFANSFLVETGIQKFEDNDVIEYVKINRKRKNEFQTATSIHVTDGEKHVQKEAICVEAEAFIEKVGAFSKYVVSDYCHNLSCHCEDRKITYPFIEGKTLKDVISQKADIGDKEGILKLLQQFYEEFFVNRVNVQDVFTKEFQHVFGTEKSVSREFECISPANIDVICDNIFMQGEKSVVIDYEWYFDFPVPVPFIMWRLLNELYYKESRMNSLIPMEEMCGLFNIKQEDVAAFLEWGKHFAYEYVGSDSMNCFASEKTHVDLKDVINKLDLYKSFETRLYYDLGEGLSERHVIRKKIQLQGNRFKIRFDLSDIIGAQYFRWDIVMKPGWVCVDRLDSNCRFDIIPYNNYKMYNHKYDFAESHYMFAIDVYQPEKVKYLEIEGRVKSYEIDDLVKKIQLQVPVEVENSGVSQNLPVQIQGDSATIRFLKKIKKKLVGKREHLLPGSVDDFRYLDSVLSCRGWAFDSVNPDEEGKIVYYDQNIKVYEHEYVLIHRKDVAAVLQSPNAEKSGFAFTSQIFTPVELTVAIEHTSGRLLLGKIPANNDVSDIQIELYEGEGQLGNIAQFITKNTTSVLNLPEELFTQEIDIIIPVYNGYEFFEELFASIELTHMKYRLIIVNDKSPDERVLPYLEKYAQEHENVLLLNNEENLGFVGSVNRALSIAEHHVVLLNTDVAVPYQWLERLMFPIICQEKVATTTPFTTCGTLCSFPYFGKDNKLVGDLSLWQMDEQFRSIKPRYPELPTGVGFCMGMNIHAINEVGLLDAETFGKGYGEENDWCRRAKGAGYKNVQVDNLFVYHKHGGSFLSEEKQKLLEKNAKALLRKHPDYNEVVARFFSVDPMRITRNYVLLKMWNQLTKVKAIVAINHNLGGGATAYLVEKERIYLNNGYKFITITYDFSNDRYIVDYKYKKDKISFSANKFDEIIEALGRVDEIWINELVTYHNLYATMDKIVTWKKEQSAELIVLLHDYFPICPAINLMDENGAYCAVGDVQRCQACIGNNISNACEEYGTAGLWREKWRDFLESSDKVIAFSRISGTLLEKAYPGLSNIVLIPHKEHYVPELKRKAKTTRTLNIGLLGILSYKKGLDVVQKMAAVIEEKQLNVRLRLIGEKDGELNSSVFDQTGRYKGGELPKLTLEQDIDIFFIPAIWPETFSYTTSEIMSMGLPIAVFDIGAPAERVSKYEKGLVLSCDTTAEDIVQEIMQFAYEVCHVNELPICDKKTLFIAQEVSFASRYRVEHFQEQMLHAGCASDYYQITDADDLDIREYKNIVIYRCHDFNRVKAIVDKACVANIPVYYDIDDFIFEYSAIQYLDFLKSEEYKDFECMTKNIASCMALCDGYLTSTESLKAQIASYFPNKPVIIKRNVASMEMQILSHNACETKEIDDEKIWIGYFSGSGTHNKDFSIIEEVLGEILEEYSNVNLRLGGVINGSMMKKYESRIDKLPFMDWRELPKAVASVDINLMPLEDTLFHCCKSENKWTEAAFVKVPSVMSRNKEMELVIEHGKTGMLCETREEWKEAIVSLIENEELRRTIAENANKVVLENYTTYNSGTEALDFITN